MCKFICGMCYKVFLCSHNDVVLKLWNTIIKSSFQFSHVLEKCMNHYYDYLIFLFFQVHSLPFFTYLWLKKWTCTRASLTPWHLTLFSECSIKIKGQYIGECLERSIFLHSWIVTYTPFLWVLLWRNKNNKWSDKWTINHESLCLALVY